MNPWCWKCAMAESRGLDHRGGHMCSCICHTNLLGLEHYPEGPQREEARRLRSRWNLDAA